MRKGYLMLFFLFVLLQCHIGYAIKCQSCIGDCKDVSTIDCGPNQQCLTLNRVVDGKVQHQQKGCVESETCNTNFADTSLTQSCCNTDLCNVDPTTSTTTRPSREPSSALACVSCDDYVCVIKSTVNCKQNELCLTKSITLAGIHMKKRGCGNSTICSKQTTEEIGVIKVTVNNTCCNYNLCNFAITLKQSSISTIGAVLFLWITKLY
ncbi:uncharacterized protein ACMZJ9_014102 [Mantella aurantiaca]